MRLGVLIAVLAFAFPGVASAATMSLRKADARLTGAVRQDVAGSSLAGLGDVNGDGRPDVAISGGRDGVAYVLFGPVDRSGPLRALVARGRGFAITGLGTSDYDWNMLRVGSAGDVNGDGLGDVAITPAWVYDGAAVPVYVVLGRRSAQSVDVRRLGGRGFRIDGAVANSQIGVSVAGGGDVDGDGIDDLAIGVALANAVGAGEAGSVYVVFGRRGTAPVNLLALGRRGFRIDGTRELQLSAMERAVDTAVAILDDVNGDRRAEIAVAANSGAFRATGWVYVVYGRTSSEPVTLATPGAQGFRIRAHRSNIVAEVASAGDVDGDGRGDLFVAEVDNDAPGGERPLVDVVFGGPTAASADPAGTWRGYSVATGSAQSLANAGDVNGDGRPDAIVGEPETDPAKQSHRGGATIVFGLPSADVLAPGEPLTVRLESAAPRCACAARGAYAGWVVAGAGDQDGDGRADVLVGAPHFTYGEQGAAGEVFLVGGPRVVSGSKRADVLRGGPGNDVLVGRGGDDVLMGGGGNDALDGGTGADRLVGGDGDDSLDGGPGRDVLAGGAGRDDLFGDTTVYGTLVGAADRLDGGAGDDFLAAGGGADAALGGAGDDLVFGEAGADRVDGGAGDDDVLGDGLADWDPLHLGAGGPRGGADVVLGGSGRDRLFGGAGRDRLDGGAGDDLLSGGLDPDRLDGGAGRDAWFRDAGWRHDRRVGVERRAATIRR